MVGEVLSVVIPCLNEEENLRRNLSGIKGLDVLGLGLEVVVVDDGSSDGTARVAEEAGVKVVSYEPNRGKGYAVRRGFEAASGDFLAILDADMTIRPSELSGVVRPLVEGECDFVNTTRFKYEMENGAMPLKNVVGNWIFNRVLSVLLWFPFSDTLAGTKVITREGLDKFELVEDSWPDHELLIKARKAGLRFKEVPVHYKARKFGESKMKTGAAFSMMAGIFKYYFLG